MSLARIERIGCGFGSKTGVGCVEEGLGVPDCVMALRQGFEALARCRVPYASVEWARVMDMLGKGSFCYSH